MIKSNRFLLATVFLLISVHLSLAMANAPDKKASEETMLEKIYIDYSKNGGVPLFKKYALFNSGIAPMRNYRRDIDSIDGIFIESIRLDIFIGKKSMPFGNTVTGSEGKLVFDYTELDQLAGMLNEKGVRPYFSWCYIPEPLQRGGDWRDGPTDLDLWKEMFFEFALHYRKLGLLIYHEVYNEPDCDDVFFLGSWDDYMQMYKYGARGLQEGDPDAVIGGPATAFIERQPGIDRFLQMILDEKLPLDFFSFHSYGYEKNDYISRVEIARNALKRYPRFDTTELHMNELNAIPYPWPKNGILDKTETAVRMLTSFEKLLSETDLTLVHWAQWLSSTVDGLGMLDDRGRFKPSMYAFRMYSEMPLNRAKVISDGGIHSLSSFDDSTASILLWNEETEGKNITIIPENIPFDNGNVYIYKLDDKSYNLPLGAGTELEPIRVDEGIMLSQLTIEEEIAGFGIIYVSIVSSTPVRDEKLPDVVINRKYHYYPERGKSNYAEFDEGSWSAWLGMGEEISARSLVGIKLNSAPEKFIISVDLSGSFESIDNNTYLGVRVDYRGEDRYLKAVDFRVIESDVRYDTAMPWGTEKAVDETVIINGVITGDTFLDIKRYAPDNWSGEAVISFDMHSTGKKTQAVFKLR